MSCCISKVPNHTRATYVFMLARDPFVGSETKTVNFKMSCGQADLKLRNQSICKT